MSDVALTDLDAAIAGTETIVAGITAGQWGALTTCTGLDVRTLVNHLVAGDLIFAARLTGWPASSAARYYRRVVFPADGAWLEALRSTSSETSSGAATCLSS